MMTKEGKERKWFWIKPPRSFSAVLAFCGLLYVMCSSLTTHDVTANPNDVTRTPPPGNTSRKVANISRTTRWRSQLQPSEIILKAKNKVSVASNTTMRRPNCAKLQNEDAEELNYAEKYLHNIPYVAVPDSDLIHHTTDCERFKLERGYHEIPLSKEEKDFPIGFALRMHDRPSQAERVFRAIYMPQNVYCLYIDKKADTAVHSAMKGIANCFSNVFIASHLENFIYNSYSPVLADLQCMQDVIASKLPWKYFINLVGSEYPLKTNLEMVRILNVLNGSNDVEQLPFPKLFEYRVQNQFMTIGNSCVPRGKDKLPFEPRLELQKGSSYNLFSRAFVEWVLTDDLAQRFLEWSKDTMSPDETVWATLNRLPQAPGGSQAEISQEAKNSLSREVVWPWSTAYCWGQHFIHSICILATRDLGRLTRRWEFFANKFDPEYDHVVLDCLEEVHGNRTQNPDPEKYVPFDFIRTFPHVKKIS